MASSSRESDAILSSVDFPGGLVPPCEAGRDALSAGPGQPFEVLEASQQLYPTQNTLAQIRQNRPTAYAQPLPGARRRLGTDQCPVARPSGDEVIGPWSTRYVAPATLSRRGPGRCGMSRVWLPTGRRPCPSRRRAPGPDTTLPARPAR